MNKTILSVVLAIHNEAENLPRCLNAVVKIADEIVVVDGASTDASQTVAKKFGAKILETTNKANFHINKQMAMDAAQGVLVLQLDADEVVDDALATYIVELKKQARVGSLPAEPKAWWIRRKNYFLQRFLSKGGQYPDPVIRLYQRGYASLPQKNVHEQMSVDGETATAAGHLLHYANPTFAVYMRKFNTYTSFEAERLYSQKKDKQLGVLQYWIIKPIRTFFSLYVRHKGLVDGFPGFLFALMSALHHPFVAIKYKELVATNAQYD
ncbi:MAG: glycosyltransferase family 2 protein [Patescibacteria group bacterium]